MQLIFAGGPAANKNSPSASFLNSHPEISCVINSGMVDPFHEFFKYFRQAVPLLKDYGINEVNRQEIAQQLFQMLLTFNQNSKSASSIIGLEESNSKYFDELSSLGFETIYLLCSPLSYLSFQIFEDSELTLLRYSEDCEIPSKLRS